MYSRVVPAVLEMKVRDVIFSIVPGIYKNRERLFQQGGVEKQEMVGDGKRMMINHFTTLS